MSRLQELRIRVFILRSFISLSVSVVSARYKKTPTNEESGPRLLSTKQEYQRSGTVN